MIDPAARIYIAGHHGLVGSAMVRRLQHAGFDNLVLKSHAELDLTYQDEVEAFFEHERPEYVFLCAAKVGGIMANSSRPAEFIYDNIMIATNVIQASYTFGVKKLLNLGSSCIYPRLAPQPLKEESLLTGALEPTNEAYAIAKIAAIKLCHYYNQQYGTDFISVMPANLYGPHDNFDLATSHVLAALIRKMHLAKCLQQGDWQALRADLDRRPIEGTTGAATNNQILTVLSRYGIATVSPDKEYHHENSGQVNPTKTTATPPPETSIRLTLWGTGRPLREFLHVDDLAEACLHLMQGYAAQQIGEFVNIGTGQDQTIGDLARLTAAVVGSRGEIEWDNSHPDGTPRKLLDVTRLQALGWQAAIGLQQGLQSTYRWYLRSHDDHIPTATGTIQGPP